MKPLLIIITGRPGSGKTTLAHLIAKRVCCPLISRDEIKEGYCITSGLDHMSLPDDANARVYHEYFEILNVFISKRISVVTEAAFQHKLWAPKLLPFRDVADIRLIRCSIDPMIANDRMTKRGLENPRREKFHRDFSMESAERGVKLPVGEYIPPEFEVPTMDVNTDGDYVPSLDEVVLFLEEGRF